MSEIPVNVERVNALRREIALAQEAKKRIDDGIRRREEGIRRLTSPSAQRIPVSPQSK